MSDVLSSLYIILMGNLIGAVVGIGGGMLLGKKNIMHYIFDLLKGIPSIILFPIAIMFFGVGNFSRIFIIFWSAFFINIITSYKGLFYDTDEEVIEASQIDGLNKIQIMFYVRLPNALIAILYGIKNAIAVSFLSIMSVEMLGAVKGIGYKIFFNYNIFNYPEMYKWIMIASSITLILNIILDIAIKITNKKLYH